MQKKRNTTGYIARAWNMAREVGIRFVSSLLIRPLWFLFLLCYLAFTVYYLRRRLNLKLYRRIFLARTVLNIQRY